MVKISLINDIHKIKQDRIPTYFIDMLSDMVLCTPRFFGCNIYTTKDGNKLLEVYTNGDICVSYDLVWSPLEYKYINDYYKIRDVISKILSEYTTFKFEKERIAYFP